MIMEERSDINGDQKMEEIMLPGFRFHPTDEELAGFYLKRKVQEKPFTIELIKPLDIYKHDPWDLPKLATTGEKEWYFYCRRDRKYRNSARPNRVTCGGFWKATGSDRPIYSSDGSRCIGLKKSLVFYKGKAAKGFKTDWMMHEFRLPSGTDHNPAKRFLDKNIPPNELWTICIIFMKKSSSAQRALSQYGNDLYNFDLKPLNVDLTPPTLPTINNEAPSTFVSSNQDTNNLFSIHEQSYNTTIDTPSSIFQEYGTESLDYITNGEQQYFNDSCLPFASIPPNTQEQDQDCIIDNMFKSLADVVSIENVWDFSNSNNII